VDFIRVHAGSVVTVDGFIWMFLPVYPEHTRRMNLWTLNTPG